MKLLLAALLLLQDPSVEQLIERLGSERIDERGDAERRLKALGRAALPALEEAARSADLEKAKRAAEVLKPLRAKIAQETFEEIEARLQACRSLRIRMTLKQEVPAARSVTEGKAELSIQSPRKAYADLQRKAERRTLVSDGESLATSLDGTTWNRRRAPAEIDKKLVAAWARAGLVYWWLATDGFMVRDPRRDFRLSDFKFGPPEGGHSCILYRIRDDEVRPREEIGTVLEVKLWYDPKTLTPVKRVWEGKAPQEVEWIWTETYDEVVLDAPLPDETFRLPEVKK